MEIDAEQLLLNGLRDGLRESIKAKMSSTYQNPFDNLIESTIAKHSEKFRGMLDEALSSALGDGDFRETIRSSVRSLLAKTLIARFGGELEKQVNVLKSDPTTRARITLAIEEIVKQAS